VSPVILSGTPPSERIWFGGGGVDLKRGSVTDSALGRDPSVLRTTPSLIATEFISGAAPMMTRRTWDKLGGFDASLFLYWEDVDLCLRARAAGLDLSIRTDVSIWHAEGGSSKTTPRTREMVYFYTSRNRITVCRTSRLHGWLLILGPGTPPLLILLRQALLRGGKGRSRRALAVLRGSITGARTRFIARSSDNSQYP
jgi:GT2 family glycosyltransferase